MSHRVKPDSAEVFPRIPGDTRPINFMAVGGTVLVGRFPLSNSRPSTKPVVPEIIDMAAKIINRRPLVDDPYKLDG